MDMQDRRQKQAVFWLTYSRQLSDSIRYTEALAAAERAVVLDPSHAEAWYVKGTCLAMLARYEEALADFAQALTLDPRYVPAWDGKAWVFGIILQATPGRIRHKHHSESQREVESAGDTARLERLKAEALDAIRQALELDPEYFEAQKRKNWLETL